MDLRSPISSIIPGGHGSVLAVLARTHRPLTGRKVAELTEGRLGKSRTLEILRELSEAGIAVAESHPPATLYSLNRDHVAADAVAMLADLRGRTIERMRGDLTTWEPAPAGAWLFGSAARGDGTPHSDIDVALIRSDRVAADDGRWMAQVSSFTDLVVRWTGNEASVLEYSESEFLALAQDGERIVGEIRTDGIHLAGGRLPVRTMSRTRR